MDLDDHDGPHPETTVPDLAARRPDVLRRLLDVGVPPQTLRTLLPEWDTVLAETLSDPVPTA